MSKLNIKKLSELLLEPPTETDWVVEDFISVGLHLLVGPPKVGKSWLSLLLGLCVCAGEPFLGFATVKSEVLYLALEDTYERIKQRSWKLVDEAKGTLCFAIASDNVGNGLIPQLEDYLHDFPETRLVIIDTFQMVRPVTCEMSYAGDYKDLTPIKAFADKNGLAIVVVHHTRKAGDNDVLNTVSGTTGVTGCADSTMVLSNVNRADGNATLTVAGRDREYMELKVRFRNCEWSLIEVTSREELEERDVPDDVLRTLDFMAGRACPWQGTATELLEAVGTDEVTVATFGKHLAQHAGFMRDRNVGYKRAHAVHGSVLTLWRIENEGGGEDE